MFIASLFRIAKRWKQLKRPLPDAWIKKMYTHTVDYHSSLLTHGINGFHLHEVLGVAEFTESGMAVARQIRRRKDAGLVPNRLELQLGKVKSSWRRMQVITVQQCT